MKIIIEFMLVFGIVFLINYIFFIRNKLKFNKKRVPMELNYLILIYNIDIKKINYKKFVYIYSIINTFIVSFIYIIVVYLLENMFLRLVVGILLLVLLIIICYGLLGRYYERKSR